MFRSSPPEVFCKHASDFTGEHPWICVVFINANSRFGCSPVNLLHICRIPFCHFVRKPLGDCSWIFFSLFSQLIFIFICFVIQVKENVYAYILARLIDENKLIGRFHASFSVLRAVSTTRRLMNLWRPGHALPTPLLYKTKTLFEKLFNFFYICFPRASEMHF